MAKDMLTLSNLVGQDLIINKPRTTKYIFANKATNPMENFPSNASRMDIKGTTHLRHFYNNSAKIRNTAPNIETLPTNATKGTGIFYSRATIPTDTRKEHRL